MCVRDWPKGPNMVPRPILGGNSISPKRPTDYLLAIRQANGELLRSSMKRFKREFLEVDKVEDKV